MAKICELTGKGSRKGSIIWRSGKSKKSGGIGTHVTAITKRRFLPNLQAREAPEILAQRRSPLYALSSRRRPQKGPRHQGAQAHLEKAGSQSRQSLSLTQFNFVKTPNRPPVWRFCF